MRYQRLAVCILYPISVIVPTWTSFLFQLRKSPVAVGWRYYILRTLICRQTLLSGVRKHKKYTYIHWYRNTCTLQTHWTCADSQSWAIVTWTPSQRLVWQMSSHQNDDPRFSNIFFQTNRYKHQGDGALAKMGLLFRVDWSQGNCVTNILPCVIEGSLMTQNVPCINDDKSKTP